MSATVQESRPYRPLQSPPPVSSIWRFAPDDGDPLLEVRIDRLIWSGCWRLHQTSIRRLSGRLPQTAREFSGRLDGMGLDEWARLVDTGVLRRVGAP